jgi:4-hydroxyphenylacetate 3-monooxygenase
MLRSGKEHIECLRDGRVVMIGNERVEDVTAHPAFGNAARTVAALYDMKADPDNRTAMSFSEGDGSYSMYYLQARNPQDLRRRMRAHRLIAEMTHGLLGRSPDHVASFVTGPAMNPSVFAANYADNLMQYSPLYA